MEKAALPTTWGSATGPDRGWGWTPQTLAFREIAALAEADAGFAAT
ncbi:hypothetical protein ACFSC4_28305 [Deinococcus malanensis]